MDVGESFQNALDAVIGFLPNLIGFLLILLVGYIVARVVAAIVTKMLQKIGLDQKLHESAGSNYVDKVMPGASPSRGIARVVFWLIFVFFLFAAIGALQIPALTTFMNDVLSYLPNVIVAILIFVIAAILAGVVGGAVVRFMGDTPTGKIVATIVPALIMTIAMFMILEQLQIAPEIIRIAFAATMFALALALALAFGLGGRSVAERMLEDAYRKGQEEKDRMRQDVQTGRDRATKEASTRTAQFQSTEYGTQTGGEHRDEGGTLL